MASMVQFCWCIQFCLSSLPIKPRRWCGPRARRHVNMQAKPRPRGAQKASLRELELNVPPEASWHREFRGSAYIYVGGLHFGLTEGDVLAVFAQVRRVSTIECTAELDGRCACRCDAHDFTWKEANAEADGDGTEPARPRLLSVWRDRRHQLGP